MVSAIELEKISISFDTNDPVLEVEQWNSYLTTIYRNVSLPFFSIYNFFIEIQRNIK